MARRLLGLGRKYSLLLLLGGSLLLLRGWLLRRLPWALGLGVAGLALWGSLLVLGTLLRLLRLWWGVGRLARL